MEQVLIGHEGHVQQVKFTPVLSDILKENVLANMAVFDPDSFLLLFLTSEKQDNGYSFEDLVNLIKKEINENPELVIEKSLDILLDSGFFSPEWKNINNLMERRFDNRNEIAKYLKSFKDDIVKREDGAIERYDKINERILLENLD